MNERHLSVWAQSAAGPPSFILVIVLACSSPCALQAGEGDSSQSQPKVEKKESNPLIAVIFTHFAADSFFDVENEATIPKALDYHAFFLADTHDFWYRSNGISTLRTKTPDGVDVRTIGARPFAGHEVDLVASYEVSKNVKIVAGYSHFFAGDYLRDTRPDDDADFGYLMTTFGY